MAAPLYRENDGTPPPYREMGVPSYRENEGTNGRTPYRENVGTLPTVNMWVPPLTAKMWVPSPCRENGSHLP